MTTPSSLTAQARSPLVCLLSNSINNLPTALDITQSTQLAKNNGVTPLWDVMLGHTIYQESGTVTMSRVTGVSDVCAIVSPLCEWLPQTVFSLSCFLFHLDDHRHSTHQILLRRQLSLRTARPPSRKCSLHSGIPSRVH